MRSARAWLKPPLRRAPSNSAPEQHTHPPQPRSPGLGVDALIATPYGPRLIREVSTITRRAPSPCAAGHATRPDRPPRRWLRLRLR